MSKPIVRCCLPKATTNGRPTYPRPITATVLIEGFPCSMCSSSPGLARPVQLCFDRSEVRAQKVLDRRLGLALPLSFGGIDDEHRGIVAAPAQAMQGGNRLRPRFARGQRAADPVRLPHD